MVIPSIEIGYHVTCHYTRLPLTAILSILVDRRLKYALEVKCRLCNEQVNIMAKPGPRYPAGSNPGTGKPGLTGSVGTKSRKSLMLEPNGNQVPALHAAVIISDIKLLYFIFSVPPIFLSSHLTLTTTFSLFPFLTPPVLDIYTKLLTKRHKSKFKALKIFSYFQPPKTLNFYTHSLF